MFRSDLAEPSEVRTVDTPMPAAKPATTQKIKAVKKLKRAKTPFDQPISQVAQHLGCLTLQGQLTQSEQNTVAAYVNHYCNVGYGHIPIAADHWKITPHRGYTTARHTFTGLELCLSTSGDKVIVSAPAVTRPLDNDARNIIVGALHDFRHRFGSPTSRKILGAAAA